MNNTAFIEIAIPDRIYTELREIAAAQGRRIEDIVADLLVHEFGGEKIERLHGASVQAEVEKSDEEGVGA